MSINLLDRVATTVRERYRRTALAQFGAGLHTDCDDCATTPDDVLIPAPRTRPAAGSRSTRDAEQASVR